MKKTLHNSQSLFAIIWLLTSILAPQALHSQGITTASLQGRSLDSSGEPLVSALIQITHLPTGRVETTRSREAGYFDFRNLAVGGPYELKVSAPGHEERRLDGLFLSLQEERRLEIRLAKEQMVELDAFEVGATDDSIFYEANMGLGSTITRRDLLRTPSVSQSVKDIAALDPRVALIDRGRGQLSALGQNFRSNNFTIDGVPTNDPFGISSGNTFPSLREPISLEMIEQVQVSLNPFNVRQSGFTGAAINAVTRSGTNDFSGSVYYRYRDASFIGDKHPTAGDIGDFDERAYGITLGGPVVRNKLFFFVGYEDFQEQTAAPNRRFTPASADLERLRAAAIGFGYDPGTLESPGQLSERDEKFLGKLDWLANDDHRLSLRYSHVRGSSPQLTPDYAGSAARTALSSYWYDTEVINDTVAAHWFANWTPTFSTEVSFSYNAYKNNEVTGDPFPHVEVNGLANQSGGDPGAVVFGTRRFQHLRDREVQYYTFEAAADWIIREHKLSFGLQFQQYDVFSDYVESNWGTWNFPDLNAFEAALADANTTRTGGFADRYIYRFETPGQSTKADFTISYWSLFLQDQWRINEKLTATLGLRYDLPKISERPVEQPDFRQKFGISNSGSIDGNSLFSPRLGFNYTLDEKTQIRGGFGLFYGRNPNNWIANSFTNNGVTISRVDLQGADTPVFSSDVSNPPTANAAADSARADVDLISDDFEMPSDWKANLSVDRRLPWFGLIASLEAYFSWVNKAPMFEHLNLVDPTILPDGRPRWGNSMFSSQQREDGYADVVLLRNTDKGRTQSYTASLELPATDFGFSSRIAYTFTDAKEVHPHTGDRFITNWLSRVVADSNEEENFTSSYNIRHRFLAAFSQDFSLVQNFPTRLTLLYDGRSARPFTYVFANNVNNDFDEFWMRNDRFYMPSGPDDPRVRWSDPAQRDAFFAFVNTNSDLASYKGQVMPRNSARDPFVHRWDLNISQEIPIRGDHRLEFSFDIINLGNLINSSWGHEEVSAWPRIARLASATFDADNNQYVYSWNGNSNFFTLENLSSRWQMLFTARYSF